MASDGPPWNVSGASQNCNLTPRHAAVNGNVATGFYVKPDSFRVLLPKVWYPGTNSKGGAGVTSPLAAGKRVVEFVVVSRGNLVHPDGTPSLLTAAQWHNGIMTCLRLAHFVQREVIEEDSIAIFRFRGRVRDLYLQRGRAP